MTLASVMPLSGRYFLFPPARFFTNRSGPTGALGPAEAKTATMTCVAAKLMRQISPLEAKRLRHSTASQLKKNRLSFNKRPRY